MSDLLLTWMSGKEFAAQPSVKVFLKSAQEKLSGDKVLLTNEATDPDVREYRFIKIFFHDDVVKSVLRDRWYAFWRYLSDIGEYSGVSHVFISDCKDVCFQANIFDAVKFSDREYLCFFSEGMTHAQSQWNLFEQFGYQTWLDDLGNQNFKEWPVLNAGTVFGTRAAVENFCMMMWLASLKSPNRFSDQAALNFLAQHVKSYIGDPRHTNYVVTGEGVKEGFVKTIADHGVCKTLAGDPYCVFHQWDRTEYAGAILEKYK